MKGVNLFSESIYIDRELNEILYTVEDIEDKKTWRDIVPPLTHRFILNCLDTNVIMIRDTPTFPLKGGKKSCFYINLREFPSIYREDRKHLLGVNSKNHRHTAILTKDMIDLAYGEIFHSIGINNFDVGVLIPHAAMNLAYGLHNIYGIPMGYGIKETEPKGWGVPRYVHVILKDNAKGLLVDDVVTEGHSKEEHIIKIQKQCEIDGVKGFNIKDVFVEVDRLQGGRKNLKNIRTPLCSEGLNLASSFNSAVCGNVGINYGKIVENQYEALFSEIEI